MSYQRNPYSTTGYQERQTSFMHQPAQPQDTGGYPTVPPPTQAMDLINQPIKQETEDVSSERGWGEPGYIPDAALNLDFNVFFYEHESTRTFTGLYKLFELLYKYTKLVIYHIFVIFLGIPAVLLWALVNATAVFIHVWITFPMIKLFIFYMYTWSPVVTAPIVAICAPLVDVSARIFRQIRIKATLNGNIADKLVGHSQA